MLTSWCPRHPPRHSSAASQGPQQEWVLAAHSSDLLTAAPWLASSPSLFHFPTNPWPSSPPCQPLALKSFSAILLLGKTSVKETWCRERGNEIWSKVLDGVTGKGFAEVISKKDLDGRRNEVIVVSNQDHCHAHHTVLHPEPWWNICSTWWGCWGVRFPSLVFENKVFIPSNLVRFGFSLLGAKHWFSFTAFWYKCMWSP